jgi:cystathionine beta-lyase family protein involved in aluminum resistance
VITGDGIGSLKEFGIRFTKADLTADGAFDMPAIAKALADKPAVVWIQRSRGYAWRDSFTLAQIGEVAALVKKMSPSSVVAVDNCYGEFTGRAEPIAAGADVICGSLIKNPGGGLAPTGGYICGGRKEIDLIAHRLTAPGLGTEVGSYTDGYRNFFQGLFYAPHTTAQALKGALLFGGVFRRLGYKVLPDGGGEAGDIICSIRFDAPDELVRFCQAVQASSPVDSFAVPEPWDMPGYTDPVIMAAGTFVQGASIELSADAPIRAPYTAYVQGGLTYEHIKIAVKECLKRVGSR